MEDSESEPEELNEFLGPPKPLDQETQTNMSISSDKPAEFEFHVLDMGTLSETDKPFTRHCLNKNGDGRLYKSRLQRSATNIIENAGKNYSQCASTSFSNNVLNTIGQNGSSTPRSCISAKPGWTSRLARYKPLQRSRTIDVRAQNIRCNPCYTDVKSDSQLPLENSEYLSSNSLENLQESSEKTRGDQLTPLLRKHEKMRTLGKMRSVYQRSRFDENTQNSSASAAKLEKTLSVDFGAFSKADAKMPTYIHRHTVSLSEPSQLGEMKDISIQISAAAVADGHVEDFVDPTRQSTSSYLKEQFFAFFQPSDNKLAMKLFGSKSALNKEKRRQQQHGKWIIHPCSSFR